MDRRLLLAECRSASAHELVHVERDRGRPVFGRRRAKRPCDACRSGRLWWQLSSST